MVLGSKAANSTGRKRMVDDEYERRNLANCNSIGMAMGVANFFIFTRNMRREE
jgi:hypothetical protein